MSQYLCDIKDKFGEKFTISDCVLNGGTVRCTLTMTAVVNIKEFQHL